MLVVRVLMGSVMFRVLMIVLLGKEFVKGVDTKFAGIMTMIRVWIGVRQESVRQKKLA